MVKGCLSARISSRAVRDRNIDRLLAYLGCHDMGGVPMTAWLLMAWRWIASSRIAQGTMFVAGLIGYHVYSKGAAKRKGAREEREQARIEAYEREAEHSGDIANNRKELAREQQERRERERDEGPRDRFNRDPFE